ncbi:MAG TPA: glycosyltransferase family 2 protein [Bacteroidia bacterium]|nr:glycosyltransferase family 2 protein [Bacteroidia bacterium]
MSHEKIHLSIIMPCLNEAETLAICIRKAKDFLVKSNITGEIVVGDNGSTDGSQKIAINEGARVVNIPERGYGAALLGAIKESKGKYVIMGDADDSYDFSNLNAFVTKLEEGNDLVMGNRFKGGIKEGAMPFLHKYLGNPVLSFIGRLFFKISVGDFHCGLRGFNRESILSLGLVTSGMEFASEMVVKASLFHLKISEVPTILSPDGRSRAPHLRTWPDGWRHLRFLLLYSPQWLFLYPGLILLCISSAFFTLLLMGPLSIGHVVLDVHTMAYSSACIIVSFQIILFFFMSRIYAMNQGLVPVSKKIHNTFNYLTLERGLIAGGILFLGGIAIMIYLLLYWKNKGFGVIVNVSETLKYLFTSIVLMVVGIQLLFSSFMFSILGIIRKEKIVE